MNYNQVKDAMEKVKNGSLELISGDVSFKDVSQSFKETNYMLSLNGVDVLMFQKNGDIINIDNTNSDIKKEDLNICKSIFYNVFPEYIYNDNQIKAINETKEQYLLSNDNKKSENVALSDIVDFYKQNMLENDANDFRNKYMKEVIEKYDKEMDKIFEDIEIEKTNELDKRLKDKENRIEEERVKIHNKDDYEKLSDFANKLDKEALNELQNILIQCEYDKNVLSDFTSAVDDMVVNKNLEGNQMPVNTIMIYDTATGDFYDISMTDKNGNAWLSFEKYVDFLNDYKNDNLVCIQAKSSTFNKFEDYENLTIKGMLDVAKANGNKLMDFVVVNVEDIKKNGQGEYNFKSLIDKNCYSYKYQKKENLKLHFNKLEVNEKLKQNQGLYANTEIKTETNTMKAPK